MNSLEFVPPNTWNLTLVCLTFLSGVQIYSREWKVFDILASEMKGSLQESEKSSTKVDLHMVIGMSKIWERDILKVLHQKLRVPDI